MKRSKKQPAKKTKPRKLYPTLRALVAGYADGEINRQEMEQILDALVMGIGLAKRDQELAEHLESAAQTFEEHPMYQAGYEVATEAAAQEIAQLTSDLNYYKLTPEDRASFDRSAYLGAPQSFPSDSDPAGSA